MSVTLDSHPFNLQVAAVPIAEHGDPLPEFGREGGPLNSRQLPFDRSRDFTNKHPESLIPTWHDSSERTQQPAGCVAATKRTKNPQ
jgi:hypothetical protein